MKLSIVIICWNDLAVISDCLRSIYSTADSKDFEVIVSDNGSTDGSIEFIRGHYPQVNLIENGRNLRFAKANNVGIRASQGEYVLILNPDTIIHEGTLDAMVRFADEHRNIGAFGCRVLNFDGTYQVSARPFASLSRDLICGLYLRWLGHLGRSFLGDSYVGWEGNTSRQVDWITGCFMLIRGDVLRKLNGFDDAFFYYFEDMDLCKRIWKAGYPIVYVPTVSITHLKGQSTNLRLPPITFALDSQITRYLFYYRHYGKLSLRWARLVALIALSVRVAGYGLGQLVRPNEGRRRRLELVKSLFVWNYRVNPLRLIENGEEPHLENLPAGRVLER